MKKTIATPSGGIDVELSAEEETAIKAEWAANDKARDAQILAQQAKEQEKQALKTKLKSSLGLSDDEIELLKQL